MEPDPPKLRFQAKAQTTEHQQAGQKQTTLEFQSVDELLRHDAAQVTPPPTLLQRLKTSLGREDPPNRSWWRRLFSRRPPGDAPPQA